jgi:hypothetical protein
MRLDIFDMERHEGKKIPSPGCCIYCGDNGSVLSDEHVIPYALAGNSAILLKACCSTCQATIQKYEQRVLRDQMSIFRARIGSPTRNPKSRPTESNLHFVEVNEAGEVIRDLGSRLVPIDDAPLAFAVWDLAPPRILDEGTSPEMHVGQPWTYVHKEKAMQLARAVAIETGSKHAAVRVAQVNRLDFLRFVAKTAHAYAAAELGLGSFRPLLPDLILGKSDDVAEFVGGDPSPDPIATGPDHMVTITAGRVTSGRAKGYTAVRLQLFPILRTPGHVVVVGAPT